MPVVISGTNGVSGVDGTASNPSYEGTDSNTGIFFPAADTIAFAEGGTEVARFDSSGNFGIGTSSPTGFGSPNLHINGTNPLVHFTTPTSGTASGDGTQMGQGGLDFDIVNFEVGKIGFWTSGGEQVRITSAGLFQFNSGYGSVATAYGCRAWVNFNGTGTVAIRASGNVSSITDNGTGSYAVNLTNAMPDANYCAVASSQRDVSTSQVGTFVTNTNASTIGIVELAGATFFDSANIAVAVFR